MTRGEEYLRALGATLLVVVSIFAAPVILAGCCAGQSKQADPPLTVFTDGQVWVKYRVVTVEGRRWLVYLGMHGWWHLAGPIDDNVPEPLPEAFDAKPEPEAP